MTTISSRFLKVSPPFLSTKEIKAEFYRSAMKRKPGVMAAVRASGKKTSVLMAGRKPVEKAGVEEAREIVTILMHFGEQSRQGATLRLLFTPLTRNLGDMVTAVSI